MMDFVQVPGMHSDQICGSQIYLGIRTNTWVTESGPINLLLSCSNECNTVRLNLTEIKIKSCTWVQQINHTSDPPEFF